MSKLIYLIRHGHSLHNDLYTKLGMSAFTLPEVTDSPLTQNGIKQADLLRRTFDKDIDLILVSPLSRALQTAHIVFGQSDIPIICEEFLREYPLGHQTCNKRSDIEVMKIQYPRIQFNIESNKDIFWKHTPETMDELNTRIEKTKEYLLNLSEKKIAIVGHSSFIGQLKDNHIKYIENGEKELQHCFPYEYILHKNNI